MYAMLYVFIGGGLGSLSRYGVSRIVTSNFQSINPAATLISNIISTTLLGFALYFIGTRAELPSSLKLLIVVGFCGGFSTFSTFSFETFVLIRSGNIGIAALNMGISIILGLGVLLFVSKLTS